MALPAFSAPVKSERAYEAALQKIAKEIARLAQRYDTPEAMQAALSALAISPEFREMALMTASRMVSGLHQNDAVRWRKISQQNPEMRRLYELRNTRIKKEYDRFHDLSNDIFQAMKSELEGDVGAVYRAQVAVNFERIVTLPSHTAEGVAEYFREQAMRGRRAYEIMRDLKNGGLQDLTEGQAKRIARTEISTAQTQLTEVRSLRLGIPCYVWTATGGGNGDGRTRMAHRRMANIIVFWNEAPEPEKMFPTLTKSGVPYKSNLGPYHAGCCPNCRCVAKPYFETAVKWPSRVFRGNEIVTWTKAEFRRYLSTGGGF